MSKDVRFGKQTPKGFVNKTANRGTPWQRRPKSSSPKGRALQGRELAPPCSDGGGVPAAPRRALAAARPISTARSSSSVRAVRPRPPSRSFCTRLTCASPAGILSAWRRSRRCNTATGRSTRSRRSTVGSRTGFTPPTVWVEGEVTELRRKPLAVRLLHAEGPGRRRVPRRDDRRGALRRAAPRPGRRRASARVRPARAVRGPRRLPHARAVDRALRARRPSRRAGAPQEEARGRRALRRRAEAAAAAVPRRSAS